MSNFDKVINRKGSLSLKWNDLKNRFNNEDCIPMWVADTDFAPPKEVLEAFRREIDHGIFGYSYYPDSLYGSIEGWLLRRHNLKVEKSHIFFNNAVVPTISLIIKALTGEGDSVLMHSPVYHPFFLITKEVKRKVVFSELIYENNRYKLDLIGFEEAIVNNKVKLFILSNPHNPGGRAWNREELRAMVNICKKYKVVILSDEIHSDLTMPNIKHIPTVTIAEDYEDNIITVMAPTKTFNLAGIKSSFFITKNKALQDKFNQAQRFISTPELNNFAIVGTEAAYNYGDYWVDEQREYIYENYKYVKETIELKCPIVKVTQQEATYLLWLSFRDISKSEEEIFNVLCKAGIGLQKGSQFGKNGEKFFRMNIGCPRATLEIALERLVTAVKDLN